MGRGAGGMSAVTVEVATVPRQRPAMWPWFLVALFLLLAIVGSYLVVENGESLLEQIPFIVAFGMFAVVGALLLSRSPRNRIGALLLYGSATTAVAFTSGEVLTLFLRRGHTDGVWLQIVGFVSNVGWMIGILPVLVFLPLLFPDGHLPSRRWVPFAWGSFAVLALASFTLLFGEPTLEGSAEIGIDNPAYVSALGHLKIPDLVFEGLLLVVLAGSFLSLVSRFRRARGIERQQIKWVALAVLLLVLSFAISSLLIALGLDPTIVDAVVTGAAFIALPVSIGIAVLQYRLYELDVVVKKTVVAGTVAIFVVAAYAAVVGFFGVIASEGESSATVFVVALALGIAFRPVTRFARRLADRLVYGRRATPYEVLTEFSERVGDAYATEDVLGRMARILGEGVGAQSARVWLRVGGELRAASVWPSDADPRAPVRVTGEELPRIEGETAVEVRDKGELLGALSVAMAPNDPMTVAKERLVRDLASQAGLVLRNVRLVEELRAAQRRIVAAQDEERRRLERNIHDGAQQQLVALSVKLRLAESLVAKDPAKAQAMLEDVRNETQTALDDLRDLARGIYPPLLADKGLAAALEAQARKSPMPVDVSRDGVRRYSQEIEAAVYFCVLEALQNAAKYAGASRTSIELGERDGWLSFKVVDDGGGFDPESVARGSGLQGIADRLSALDGKVEVRSVLGHGTTIVGRIPVDARD
jgi:signal transduction histidine kinase